MLRLLGAPERAQRTRHTALTAVELAHMVVAAVRAGDRHALRELFLAGPQAREALGTDEGRRYLDALDARLGAELDALRRQVSGRAVVGAVREEPDGRLFVEVREPDEPAREVYLGQARAVGHAWRMFLPPGGLDVEAPTRRPSRPPRVG